ncbi:uncharacterized protein MKZ38_004072 [Zalerion maritima]|uniref:Flavin reductase like domain-containing protein n=1 Tax=Zalerion maritima TaxID=339359 RepID=A0AAD5S4F8_9PEZI|nr:uncharacterized protein MKZ38_004072 [Zalerion maritima]
MRRVSRILGSPLDAFLIHGTQLISRRPAWLPCCVRVIQSSLIHSRSRSQTWRVDLPKPPSVHPHASRAVSLPLPEQLRGLMRLMTHSVVVCTSALPADRVSYDHDESNHRSIEPYIHGPPVPRAMTMSSFTSLALSPVPVVTFNVAVPSRTLDAVVSSQRFNIHILAGDCTGAAVADRFSKGNLENGLGPAFESDDTCAVSWDGDSEYPPVLDGQGVLYVLRCRLLHDRGPAVDEDQRADALLRVKDHIIVLGEVMEILEGSGRGEEKDEKFGLLYADRMYRFLGNVLTKGK